MRVSALVTTVVLVLGLAAAALAQPAAQPAPPPDDPNAAAYKSPMRAQCEAELKQDKGWYGDLKEQCYGSVQKDADAYATANNRHVVIAYAAFWLLTVGFVVVQWRRQQALKADVARLEVELARALKDEGKGGGA